MATVVCSQASSKVNLLNDDTYHCRSATIINYVILQKDRARGALIKEILDLLNEKNISGACSGRASL